MSTRNQDLQAALRKFVAGPPALTYKDAEIVLKKELESLVNAGALALEPDESLTGTSLEIRIRRLFATVGFAITSGREGQEDLIVAPPTNANTQNACVLEVKSHKGSAVQRDDLRQLDDWVFDLSGEEQARKKGLGGGLDALSMLTTGLQTQQHHHPTPHKGILIFNGPIGLPFAQRSASCVHPNDATFIQKRNFCIVPLQRLTASIAAIQSQALSVEDFWEQLHSTAGQF